MRLAASKPLFAWDELEDSRPSPPSGKPSPRSPTAPSWNAPAAPPQRLRRVPVSRPVGRLALVHPVAAHHPRSLPGRTPPQRRLALLDRHRLRRGRSPRLEPVALPRRPGPGTLPARCCERIFDDGRSGWASPCPTWADTRPATPPVSPAAPRRERRARRRGNRARAAATQRRPQGVQGRRRQGHQGRRVVRLQAAPAGRCQARGGPGLRITDTKAGDNEEIDDAGASRPRPTCPRAASRRWPTTRRPTTSRCMRCCTRRASSR